MLSAHTCSQQRYGFLTAMASNIAFQSRNVISKKFLQDRWEFLDLLLLCIGKIRFDGTVDERSSSF